MRRKLHVKGWKDSEICDAEMIVERAHANKHPAIQSVEHSLLWFTIAVGVLGSAILALISLPIMVAGTEAQAAFMALLFGFLMGLLIIYISTRMHWLEEKHHFLIAMIIPLSGVTGFVLSALKANQINMAVGIMHLHQPFVLGLVYFVGFLAPYSLYAISSKARGVSA